MHRTTRAAALMLVTLFGAASSRAQSVERPIAFDSAGRVRAVTPGLVARLKLSAPAWPVLGAFNEARIYHIEGDGYVIVAQIDGGALRRYVLNESERAALQSAIATAMLTSGRLVGEEATGTISQPARGAFVRNQVLLTALVYAPAAATLTHDGKGGTAVWLLLTGGTYFTLSSLSRDANITRAQNHLATDGGVRGAIIANGLLHTFGVDPSDDVAVGTGLAGALGGAVLGFNLGKKWTDGEAHAATFTSTAAALTTLGVIAATRTIGDTTPRAFSGAGVGAAIAGYALGPLYPRRAGYRVTAGDVGMLRITSVLGVAAASIPFIDRDRLNERTLAGALTGGLVAGILAGDIFFVRPFDHSESDVGRVGLGALAGALLGGGIAVLSEPDASGAMALITGGAIAGTFITDRTLSPTRSSARSGIPLLRLKF
ncbi:MAG TPA: hypothetical protein VJR92_06000 [Gemmatimonadaceae bacterium]|nr:hypothetical protein [Gemmatimonadaceae bacterium]